MTQFTDELRQFAAPIWEADLRHPFVRGIADGTLPMEKFKFYLIQDYLFLLDYSRVFAYGVIKAPDEATMALFSQLLNETLNTEMDLHRGYCEKFGISAAEMEQAPVAPTNARLYAACAERCTERHTGRTHRWRFALPVGLRRDWHNTGRTGRFSRTALSGVDRDVCLRRVSRFRQVVA